jgi:hypothetical protein
MRPLFPPQGLAFLPSYSPFFYVLPRTHPFTNTSCHASTCSHRHASMLSHVHLPSLQSFMFRPYQPLALSHLHVFMTPLFQSSFHPSFVPSFLIAHGTWHTFRTAFMPSFPF